MTEEQITPEIDIDLEKEFDNLRGVMRSEFAEKGFVHNGKHDKALDFLRSLVQRVKKAERDAVLLEVETMFNHTESELLSIAPQANSFRTYPLLLLDAIRSLRTGKEGGI